MSLDRRWHISWQSVYLCCWGLEVGQVRHQNRYKSIINISHLFWTVRTLMPNPQIRALASPFIPSFFSLPTCWLLHNSLYSPPPQCRPLLTQHHVLFLSALLLPQGFIWTRWASMMVAWSKGVALFIDGVVVGKAGGEGNGRRESSAVVLWPERKSWSIKCLFFHIHPSKAPHGDLQYSWASLFVKFGGNNGWTVIQPY